MRTIALSLAFLLVASASSSAATLRNKVNSCDESWAALAPAGKALTSYSDYTAACVKGGARAEKSNGAPPPRDATGKCRDGSFVTGRVHRGICGGHGGVTKTLRHMPHP